MTTEERISYKYSICLQALCEILRDSTGNHKQIAQKAISEAIEIEQPDEEQIKNEIEADKDFYKNLLTNIYKASDYLGSHARMCSNDLLAPDFARQKSCGNADAYDAIKKMIIMYDSIGQVDYYKINNIVKDLPNVLK